MSRYILSNKKHEYNESLFLVMDNGKKTKAYAKENVTFSDNCEVIGGVFYGGEFYGGMFYDGVFRDGEFRGGTFYDGVFYGGTFYDGEFRGGEFRGGTFSGGTFYDGVFRGGTFYDGVFYGGTFSGGYLFLQIQGSKHFVNVPDGENIKIGCKCMSPNDWLLNFEQIGEIEGYTAEQIAEYKLYIDLASQLIKGNKR